MARSDEQRDPILPYRQPAAPGQPPAARARLRLIYPLAAFNALVGGCVGLLALWILTAQRLQWEALLPMLLLGAAGSAMLLAAACQMMHRYCPWRLAVGAQVAAMICQLLLAGAAGTLAMAAAGGAPHFAVLFFGYAAGGALLLAGVSLGSILYLRRSRVRGAFGAWMREW